MNLPQPKLEGPVSLEETIAQRRTIRSFDNRPLSLQQLAQLLWAAQGITGNRGLKRAAPSAGALYPMDIYSVIGQGRVKDTDAGIFHYMASGHKLSLIKAGDHLNDIAKASLSQMWMARAPLNLVITAEYKRVAVKYGDRAERYAMIEAGHIGQNIFLQAEALGLKAGIVGAFQDRVLNQVMGIPRSHEPLLVMPVGYPN